MRVTCLRWKIDFCVSFTYGLNKIIERNLWDNLKQYGYFIANPWILLGDINDVLSLEEKIGGIHVRNYEIKDFVDCFAHLDLHDMWSMGCTHTWMSSTVRNKLDRVMINHHWTNANLYGLAEFLATGCVSDHALCLVTILEESIVRKKRLSSVMWTLMRISIIL